MPFCGFVPRPWRQEGRDTANPTTDACPAPTLKPVEADRAGGDPNALHWQLDVYFREDPARNRNDNSPGNFAILRLRALDVICREPSKSSLSVKHKRTDRGDTFLIKIAKSLAVG